MDRRRPTVSTSFRDLAVAMMRCGWSMAMLGAERAADLAAGRPISRRDAEVYDEAAHRAAGSLTGEYREVYRAGERMGRTFLDTLLDGGEGGPFDPRRIARGAAGMACRAADIVDDALPRRRNAPPRPHGGPALRRRGAGWR